MGRGAQDRAMQMLSKNQGWDPTEIVGDAYDAEKGNALRWSQGYGDKPGPDSPPGDASVSMNDTNGIQFAEERMPQHKMTHGDPNPGKPM